jgi:hypothetical protein
MAYCGRQSRADPLNMRRQKNWKPNGLSSAKAVVDALIRSKQYDESDLQGLASAGRLRKAFPFEVEISKTDVPPDTIPKSQLRRASSLPLTKRQHMALIRSSASRKNVPRK